MTKKNLEQAIVNCLRNGHKAFIPYIMAGDGGLDQLKDRILCLQAAGATAIELGIPFQIRWQMDLPFSKQEKEPSKTEPPCRTF